MDSDHIRTAYFNKNMSFDSAYYRPRLTIDEKYKVKSQVGHGEVEICSNRAKCRKRAKVDTSSRV